MARIEYTNGLVVDPAVIQGRTAHTNTPEHMIPAHVAKAIQEQRYEAAAIIRKQYSKPSSILSTRTPRGWYSWTTKENGAYYHHEYHVNACLHLATRYTTRKQAEDAQERAFWIATK